MNTDKRFNSRKFKRCEILITFQRSGPDHWNVSLRRTYAQNGLYMVFKILRIYSRASTLTAVQNSRLYADISRCEMSIHSRARDIKLLWKSSYTVHFVMKNPKKGPKKLFIKNPQILLILIKSQNPEIPKNPTKSLNISENTRKRPIKTLTSLQNREIPSRGGGINH